MDEIAEMKLFLQRPDGTPPKEKDRPQKHRKWKEWLSIGYLLHGPGTKCKLLKSSCPEYSKRDFKFQKAFALADGGDVEGLEQLLSAYPDYINIRDENSKTLMHHAAEHGHELIIDMLVGKGCTGIRAPDNEGNTPLHIAAMFDKISCTKTLIAIWRSSGNGKIGFCVRNESMETPMHFAVRHGSAGSLECLLSTCNGGVSSPGWHGETPLHVASCMNNVECAKILIKYGADPLKACFSGMKPIHVAARRASVDLLRFFLTDSGTSKEVLLALVDDEDQTPLHWAVNNGDLETVDLLMQHGAKLDTKMYDQSTPLHLACSQGLICVVCNMYDVVRHEFMAIVSEKDAQGMTCLHRATMFNHTCVVIFLLEKGVSMNETDNEGRTALILAASRASWDCQDALLRAGADAVLTDHYGRNFLHYLIANGNSPEICQESLGLLQTGLLNQTDTAGCTPLHYAAQNGSLRSSAGLVRLGACVCIKDKQSQSPLHFAARYGRYNTAKRLLETAKGYNLINDADKNSMTALHLAAENGHSRVVQLLMSKGAIIHRDYSGKTPLHLAAASNYRETVDVIVVHYAHLIDSVDKEGNTALHLAAANNAVTTVTYLLTAGAALVQNSNKQLPVDIVIQRKHRDTANAMVQHERWEEIFSKCSAIYTCPVLGLIEHLPEVMAAALDRCVVGAPCHPLAKNYFLHFDYKFLEPHDKPLITGPEDSFTDVTEPLIAMNTMVRHARSELLSHPVCSSYLNKKWASYGVYFHGIHVAVYSIFLAFLTYLVCAGVKESLVPTLKGESVKNLQFYAPDHNETTDDGWTMPGNEDTLPKNSFYGCAAVAVAIFTIANIVKEVYQMVQQQRYFKELVNYLEWILYITTTLFALAYYDTTGVYISWKARWQLGACAIFFGWFNFMLYLQRFGLMGIYVVMFLGILKTLLRALFVFIFVIIAFALAFHVLLPLMVYPDQAGFYQQFAGIRSDQLENLKTPHFGLFSSLLRITGMMLGDLDVIHNYIYPMSNGALPFPQMTSVFLVLFVIIVSILLMNLLIGLAVGDIEDIQRSATLRRIGMQVELHTILERKFPRWFLRRVRFRDDKYYPNRSAGFFRKIWFITKDPAEALRDQNTCSEYTFLPGRICAEMQKQQTRMRDFQGKMDQQHDLLRLIVQKMQIHDEADELDEGTQPNKCGRNKQHSTLSTTKRAKWVAGSVQAKTRALAAFVNHNST
ncbi:transient receptor potential cation channel subfamily A member 1-like isoform X2 [Paramacrobiotus metropolitanus]|uniref:transient receptor potential cation channel subfamily A member 1-like isoform X2 n=1 Tax=Paramacrobiotus metropolitanus TaxID=2943436 RepID=UPI0024462B20|nr:transient receptor potential cation channel subfamily A member 1-like isoform X2 [Paramacrobiotus metropolitanus]